MGRVGVLSVLLVVVCACQHVYAIGQSLMQGMGTESETNAEQQEVTKGVADTCEYSLLSLPNSIEVIFARNTHSSEEIVVMHVDAGAEYDTHPGTAHLLEHLLFSGTEKYSDKSGFYDFIAKYGGVLDAITSISTANYHYRVPSGIGDACLDEAMDRFAQFFVHPLLRSECISSEISVVDSEYRGRMGRHSDVLRYVHVAYANQDHPINCFTVGNRETLEKDNIGVEVAEFYRKHYIPQNMVLMVYTSRDIEHIKKFVVDAFGKVGGGNVVEKVPRRRDIPVYLPEAFSRVLKVWTSNNRTIYITYDMPDKCFDVEKKPHRYLINLLCGKNKGSLFNFLKETSLVTSLNASYNHNLQYGCGCFQICADLTERGLMSYEAVAAAIFAYIEMIRDEPVNIQALEEDQAIQRTHFDAFTYNKGSAIEDVMFMPGNLKHYGFKNLVSSNYLIREIDPEAVKEYMNALKNNFITVFDPEFDDDLDENNEEIATLEDKWYGTQYRNLPYERDEELIGEMKSAIGRVVFPPPNKFISTGVVIKGSDTPTDELPVALEESERDKLWYRMDNRFHVPEAIFGFVFKGMYRFLSVRNEVMVELFCKMVNHVVLKELCSIFRAGYSTLVERESSPENGISVMVSGYDGKIGEAVVEVVKRIATAAFEQDLLDSAKRDYKEMLQRWEGHQGRIRGSSYWTYCLNRGVYIPSDKIDSVDGITLMDIEECAQALFGSAKMETLAYGNIYQDEAKEVHRRVVEILAARYPRRDAFEFKIERISLAEGCVPFFYKSTHESESCVILHLEVGALSDLRSMFLKKLFLLMTNASFFAEMRRKHELGYTVYQTEENDNTAYMIVYLIQTCKPVAEVYARLVEFLDITVRMEIEDMQEATFEEYKRSLVASLKTRDSQSAEFAHMNYEILSGTYDFDGRCEGMEIVEGLTKDDLLRFVDENIVRRRSLCVAMMAEDRCEDEIAELLIKGEECQKLVLVHLDAESVQRWRDSCSEHCQPANVE